MKWSSLQLLTNSYRDMVGRAPCI